MAQIDDEDQRGSFQDYGSQLQKDVLGRMSAEEQRRFRETSSNEVLRISEATRPAQVVWEVRNMVEVATLAPAEAPEYDNQFMRLQFYWALLGLQRKLALVGDPVVSFLGYSPDRVGTSQFRYCSGPEIESMRSVVETELAFYVAMSKFNAVYGRYEANGGSIDQVANNFTIPIAYHLQARDLNAIFNAGPTVVVDSSVNKLPENLRNSEEITPFGANVDRALRAYFVISLCEKTKDFLDLMGMPGWSLLSSGIELEIRENLDGPITVVDNLGNLQGEVRSGESVKWIKTIDGFGRKSYEVELKDGSKGLISELSVSKVIDENFLYGNPRAWRNGRRESKSLAQEKDYRGVLTKYGNIFAHAETEEERKEVRTAVLKYIANGDKLAEEVAFRMFRLFGMAAHGSYEKYSDGLDQEGFPTTDDMVKIMQTKIWQEKQTKGGHNCGPDATKGEFERFAVDFLRYTAVDTDKLGDGFGTVATGTKTRSFFELWWGYFADEIGQTEKAHRLGELPWEKMPPHMFRDWMLRIFYAGKKDGGMLSNFTSQTWSGELLLTEDFYEGFNKALNIMVQPAIMLNGKFRGSKDEDFRDGALDKEKMRLRSLFTHGISNLPQWSGEWAAKSYKALKDAKTYAYTEMIANLGAVFGFDFPGQLQDPSLNTYIEYRKTRASRRKSEKEKG